jgi:hypothetical protein
MTRLRESNAKLKEDLEGESCGCLRPLAARFLPCSDLLVAVVGARVYRAGMTMKFAELK